LYSSSYYYCADHPHLLSFPTRRSSDLKASGEEPVMGSSSVRERIAIVFMTLSVVATLVLGGALAAQLGHPKQQVVQIGAASATSDRKSTRLNSSHQIISYAVFCLKKKK